LRPLCALLVLALAAACSAPAPEDDAGEAPPDAAGGTASAPSSRSGDPSTAEPSPAPPPVATACTQIGCSDGLGVELDGFQEEVEIELTAGEETRTLSCLPPGPCHHFVPEFLPEEVTMTVFLLAGEEQRTFTPEYRDERPNGPDCPPVCRQARIRWKL
ncbi:MAG TPA: hypothetical protein VHM02_16375, partial [Thermoanaerobaculia bacterium]|nr:hypothetical protein [Thermoanaerobaculia bacterium]